MRPSASFTRAIPLTLAPVALAILLATGCGDDGETDSGAAVRPIESILASDIELTFDPSGTAATLTVDTTIPVACAVIYGPDDDFGAVAVDDDMQGGAHADHSPRLTGLVPDTEYRYVLQGSDASGTIYRSDTLTFRTPSAAETDLGPNVAPTGSVTAVSSEFSEAFAAANAVDGDLGTEWSTAGDGDDAWIELDLGDEREITAVAYRTREMTDGTAITDTFTLTVEGETLGPFTAGVEPVVLDRPRTGRIVRIDAETTSGGNTGAVEIELYSPA